VAADSSPTLVVIMVTVLGVNMFAEGLQGLFDPRRR